MIESQQSHCLLLLSMIPLHVPYLQNSTISLNLTVGSALRALLNDKRNYSVWQTKQNYDHFDWPLDTNMVLKYPVTTNMLRNLIRRTGTPNGKMLPTFNYNNLTHIKYSITLERDHKAQRDTRKFKFI